MSSLTFTKSILAVITMRSDQISGGAPIFIVNNEEELENKSFLLEKILDGMAHQLDPHTMIIVRHR